MRVVDKTSTAAPPAAPTETPTRPPPPSPMTTTPLLAVSAAWEWTLWHVQTYVLSTLTTLPRTLPCGCYLHGLFSHSVRSPRPTSRWRRSNETKCKKKPEEITWRWQKRCCGCGVRGRPKEERIRALHLILWQYCVCTDTLNTGTVQKCGQAEAARKRKKKLYIRWTDVAVRWNADKA